MQLWQGIGCQVWLQTVHKSHSKHSGGTFLFPSHTYRHVDLSSQRIVSRVFCLSLSAMHSKPRASFFCYCCFCYSSLAHLHPCGILPSMNGCLRTNLVPCGKIYLCVHTVCEGFLMFILGLNTLFTFYISSQSEQKL